MNISLLFIFVIFEKLNIFSASLQNRQISIWAVLWWFFENVDRVLYQKYVLFYVIQITWIKRSIGIAVEFEFWPGLVFSYFSTSALKALCENFHLKILYNMYDKRFFSGGSFSIFFNHLDFHLIFHLFYSELNFSQQSRS